MASAPFSRHYCAMMNVGSLVRSLALLVISALVAASTVMPSLAFAQKYADHLSHYGGYDVRIATLSGFSSLYVNPDAPMLPVVLAVPSSEDMATILPTPCAMDKTVLPHVSAPTAERADVIAWEPSLRVPAGLSPTALRGPP